MSEDEDVGKSQTPPENAASEYGIDGEGPVTIFPGTGLRLSVGGTCYEVKCTHPLDRGKTVHHTSDGASSIELEPYPKGGIESRDSPNAELFFTDPDRDALVATIPESPTRYIDDVLADLHVIRAMLNDARPLEALSTANDAIDRLEEERDDE